MKVAILDCGTNTFNLLIAEVGLSQWGIAYAQKFGVKLQEGGFSQGNIREEPFERGQNAIAEAAKIIQKYQVDQTIATATSALREAKNGKAFIAKAKKDHGVAIELIDGNREAELIWKGVRQSIHLDEAYLVMDIGGGSTEFIIGKGDDILWKKSYKLGVSRLFERLLPKDPMISDDVRVLRELLDDELKDLRMALNEFPCKTLVGSSGSFDSIVDIISHRWGRAETLGGSTEILLNQFNVLYEEMLTSTKAERLQIKGLTPMRADFMVISMILIDFVVRQFGLDNLHRSAYALKEGQIAELQGSLKIME